MAVYYEHSGAPAGFCSSAVEILDGPDTAADVILLGPDEAHFGWEWNKLGGRSMRWRTIYRRLRMAGVVFSYKGLSFSNSVFVSGTVAWFFDERVYYALFSNTMGCSDKE